LKALLKANHLQELDGQIKVFINRWSFKQNGADKKQAKPQP